jgi:hypothetical protein
LQVKLEGVDWDRIGHRTQLAVERAMERMQRDMDRLVRKAERRRERLERMADREELRREKLERKRRKVRQRLGEHEGRAGVADWSVDISVDPEEPGPDLDEERLSILKMVEQGQITPEEAEMLLDALE